MLREPLIAAQEVHEVVRAIASELRPGYLEIHRDQVDSLMPVPREVLEWDGSFPPPRSDPRKLREAVAETRARIRAARRPILIGGVELFREGAERDFLRLAERLEAPVVTTPLAKGVFPMDHPQHMGIHIGPFSAERDPAARAQGGPGALARQPAHRHESRRREAQVLRERSVWAIANRVNVSFHTYTDVTLRDFVRELADQDLPRFPRAHPLLRQPEAPRRQHARARAAARISINDLLVEVNDFLAEHRGYDVFAESGDMLFGGLEIRQAAGGLYFAQGYYASMGFAVPAALGAQIGTGRRPLVLCGDGGFQMTGPGDLACARARPHADRAAREQRRLGDLPAGHAAPRPARDPAVALRGAGAGVGRRGLPRRVARRAARGAARRARGARVRDHRVPRAARPTSRRSRAATSAPARAKGDAAR